jgi:hypothetical protein
MLDASHSDGCSRHRFPYRWTLITAVTVLIAALAHAQGFEAAGPLNGNAASDVGGDHSGRVVTDGSGTWLAVWSSDDTLGATIDGDTDIFFARSTDGGITWSAPAALNSNAASDTGSDALPSLATDGAGTWIATWQSTDTLGSLGTDRDILMARSMNGGLTWTSPAPVNANAATDGLFEHDLSAQIATDGTTWVVVWESGGTLGGTIDVDPDILSASSTNGGATWSDPIPVNTTASTDSSTTSDEFPFVATDGAGVWLATWTSENTLGGTIGSDLDVLFARSTDGGATWSDPEPLNSYAASDDTRVDQPARLATDGAGTWIAVWSTQYEFGGAFGGDDLAVAVSTDGGLTWGAATQLNSPLSGDSDDFAPAIASDGAGTWAVVWESEDPSAPLSDRDILLMQSTDDGATWTKPVPLAKTDGPDGGSDETPDVAADASGRWVVVWESTDELNGTLDSDYDILVTSGATTLPVGVPGRKLVVVDKLAAADSAKTVFVVKDPAATKGTGLWDSGLAIDLHLAYGDGSASGTFVVPAGESDGTAGWLVNKPAVAKYVNKAAPAGEAQTKVAIVKPAKLLKLVAKDLGENPFDILVAGAPSPHPAGEVVSAYCVTNEAERFCHCSSFPVCSYRTIAGGTGAKLVCKNGLPDTSCEALPDP